MTFSSCLPAVTQQSYLSSSGHAIAQSYLKAILFWDILKLTVASSHEDAVKSTHTHEYAAFMEGLIRARKKGGLTQRTVADKLGKPQSFVSKYESGERRLDVVEFLQIARVLGEDPATLLQEMGLY